MPSSPSPPPKKKCYFQLDLYRVERVSHKQTGLSLVTTKVTLSLQRRAVSDFQNNKEFNTFFTRTEERKPVFFSPYINGFIIMDEGFEEKLESLSRFTYVASIILNSFLRPS